MYISLLSCCVCACRLAKIKEWVDSRDPHAIIIPFSAGLELMVSSQNACGHRSLCIVVLHIYRCIIICMYMNINIATCIYNYTYLETYL